MRHTESLNGRWHYTPLAKVTIAQDARWKTVTNDLPPPADIDIPAHWECNGLQPFAGTVRFERTFIVPSLKQRESLWLLCRGIDYFATLSINGQVVASHEGYFQHWELDITAYLHDGENSIALDVTCPQEEPGDVWPHRKRMIKGILSHWDCRPGSWDIKTGQDIHSGGIWNDVLLEVRPETYIKQVRTQTLLTPPEELLAQDLFEHHVVSSTDYVARLLVTTEVVMPQSRQHDGPLQLEIHVGEHVAHTSIEPTNVSSSTVETLLTIPEPRLWWTWDQGEPYLYDFSVSLRQNDQLLDQYESQVGLREIALDPVSGAWTLNKRRIFVRGTNIVPTLWLGEYDKSRIAQDVALLKQANVNGVRMCVHVNREELYTALDRAGILVWQDFALQWGYQQTSEFIAEAVRQMKDMVRQLRHHPCIALWCCQNESSQFNQEILDPILAQAAREEDSSRYVRPTSELQEHLYHGWYFGQMSNYRQAPTSPIISEFGAQALPSVAEMQQMIGTAWPPDWQRMGYHDFQYEQTFHVAHIPTGENWNAFVAASQQYQAQLLKLAIERFRRAKYHPVGSLFQFMFMDCWPSITWSVVSYDRRPKEGYAALRDAYQPVLVGTTLERDTWTVYDASSGFVHILRPTIVPWVVNDNHIAYPDARVTISLFDPTLQQEFALGSASCHIAEDSVVTLPPVELQIPSSLTSGSYIVQLQLEHAEGVLSRNSYPVEVQVITSNVRNRENVGA